jgi:hypothetical protein
VIVGEEQPNSIRDIDPSCRYFLHRLSSGRLGIGSAELLDGISNPDWLNDNVIESVIMSAIGAIFRCPVIIRSFVHALRGPFLPLRHVIPTH